MFPAAFIGSTTASGDAALGPGAPTVIVGTSFAVCLGDAVSGPACVGSVMMGSPTVLAMGRPMARITSSVVGVNPVSGVPVTTTMALGWPTCLVM